MADSKWMQRIEAVLGEVAVRAHRRPGRALAIAAVLTAIGMFGALRLSVIADLEHLLPKTFKSVQDLEPLRQRFGGIGYVVVVGMDAEVDQLRRFAEDMAPKLEKLPGIRYVDFRRAGKFFEERALYYLSLEDLNEVARRIKEREKYERRQQNPMFVKLDDEPPPSLDMSDIEAKYGRRSDQRLAGSGEDYFLDPEKKMVVLLAKPAKIASDLAFSEQLVKDVEGFLAKEDLKQYGANFHVGLTGTFKYKVDQQRQLSGDMAMSSTLALVVLIAYLIFHFRSVVALFFVVVPVAVGLSWTYGVTWAVFGSLNVLTGFLGAILGGLGVEHGFHLLGRYEALRSKGVSSEDAVREAFLHTGGSALVSSAVASLAFIAIAYSEFRAFREFGTIAAIGMPMVLGGYFAVLPAFLGIASRMGWKPKHIEGPAWKGIAKWIALHPGKVAASLSVAMAVAIGAIPGVRFDYDFHSLEDSTLPSFELDRQTNEILGYSQEPVVILTERSESERSLVKALKERQAAQGAKSTVDFVAALDDLVPEHQAEKRQVLDQIGVTVAKVKEESLDAQTRPSFEKLKRWVAAQPFVRSDIPEGVRRQFEGISKSAGGFVLIFPSIKLSDGQAVRAFAKEVREIHLPGGEHYSAAGEAMILADVLEMIIREAQPILYGAIIAVLLALWATLGNLWVSVLCFSPTVLSILAMCGEMVFFKLPFNYLNIMVVPVLIGTTVDAGVHLVSRLSEAEDDLQGVYAETGRAIWGGLFTSGVGFSALLRADHPGLNSLGRLALIGFVTNLVVMLVWFPAMIILTRRWRERKAGAAKG